MKTLAVIHTSMVFIDVEPMMKDLFEELMPQVRLINIVDDSLLPDVMKAGIIIPDVTSRMCDYVVAAEKTGADAILSLCSSLGPAIDVASERVNIPVIKLDDAMAVKASESAKKIGVMATVVTTLNPTVELIKEKAKIMKKELEIVPCVVEGAFDKLMGGERAVHDQMVMDSAENLAKSVDTIVFAQASMTRLAERVAKAVGKDVLTSPRLGIKYMKTILDGI
jgi:Asp/Glu/hydantoin racemase